MNLPPEERFKTVNTYFAGITPGPNAPDVQTITAVTDPIIDFFVEFWNGKLIFTYQHPEGVMIRVAILPLIADLIGSRKAAGFATHSATQFCSFCHLTLDKVASLDIETWTPRTATEVLQVANQWKAAKTISKRKEITKATGIRWSALHRLPYRDPVRHVVLGVMHNWLEGVLQHHFRKVQAVFLTALFRSLNHITDLGCGCSEEEKERKRSSTTRWI